MRSIHFLKKQLSKLVKNIPYIKCRYFFRKFDNTHIINVEPKYFFKNDENYIELEDNIIIEFIQQFPYEGIVFLSDEKLVNMDKPIAEFVGEMYDMFTLIDVIPDHYLAVPIEIAIETNSTFRLIEKNILSYNLNKEFDMIEFKTVKNLSHKQLSLNQDNGMLNGYEYSLAA